MPFYNLTLTQARIIRQTLENLGMSREITQAFDHPLHLPNLAMVCKNCKCPNIVAKYIKGEATAVCYNCDNVWEGVLPDDGSYSPNQRIS